MNDWNPLDVFPPVVKPKQTTCPYCGMLLDDRAVLKTVWHNGERKELYFCDGKCASHYQMSAEG